MIITLQSTTLEKLGNKKDSKREIILLPIKGNGTRTPDLIGSMLAGRKEKEKGRRGDGVRQEEKGRLRYRRNR